MRYTSVMTKKLITPKKIIMVGAVFLILGIVIGIPLAFDQLGKGEANMFYRPGFLLQSLTYVVGIMFYGGPILIVIGIIWAIIARLRRF